MKSQRGEKERERERNEKEKEKTRMKGNEICVAPPSLVDTF